MGKLAFDIEEYFSLSRGCGFVELPEWSSVTLRGNDRQEFLHKFCTNDIRRLAPGDSCEAFITNVKGKVLGHGLVTCREGELVLTAVPGLAPSLITHLDRYIIREDVQLSDTTSERAYILVAGDVPAHRHATALAPTIDAGQSFLRPLMNAEGKLFDIPVRWIRWDLLGPVFCGLIETQAQIAAQVREALVERDVQQCGRKAFYALRVEAGTPLFGVDFDDRNFPQEVGRNEQAISFTKGCYLGQETVARIDALGHVNQQVAGVRFSGEQLPEIGSVLTHAEKAAGHVSSAVFSPALQAPLALAMLRREHGTPGSRLDSPMGTCEVIALPLRPSP